MKNKIWEFFENMNDIVYVSDTHTYEIIYMNKKVKEILNISSIDEVKDKKCYEVFQGRNKPCVICTNSDLRVGYFEEWKYFNPMVSKPYIIKDTLVEDDGKLYRIEIAIDISYSNDIDEQEQYINNEELINEIMKIAMSFSSADEGLENLLEYLGVILKCESVHIFEDINNLYFKNTYEWCLKENFSKKESLREINHSYIDKCLKRFREKRNIIIKDIENAKKFDNKLYKYLKDNHIHTLVACPLIDNNKVIGILAVINPPIELIDNIASLFQIMSYFIVLILNRRTLMKQLETLSYYDQLTGFGNRHAMNKFVDSLNEDDSFGLVYCDVTGLKKINDTLGHKAGDAVLIRTCQCLKENFKDNYMFRLGGDEFLVICPQIEEEKLLYQVDILKENMKNYNVVLAVGSVFSEKSSVDFDKLLSIADKKMYEDKRRYYKEKDYG